MDIRETRPVDGLLSLDRRRGCVPNSEHAPIYIGCFALTLVIISVDLGINLLVLACRTGSIGEDLLRGI